MIQTIRAKDRYHAETDRLSTNWHFSFDRYYDPNNVQLRQTTPATFHLDDFNLILKAGVEGPCIVLLEPETVAYRKHETNSIRDPRAMVDGILSLIESEKMGSIRAAARAGATATRSSAASRSIGCCNRSRRESRARRCAYFSAARLCWSPLREGNCAWLFPGKRRRRKLAVRRRRPQGDKFRGVDSNQLNQVSSL